MSLELSDTQVYEPESKPFCTFGKVVVLNLASVQEHLAPGTVTGIVIIRGESLFWDGGKKRFSFGCHTHQSWPTQSTVNLCQRATADQIQRS